MNGPAFGGVVLRILPVVGVAAIGISAYTAGVTAGIVEAGHVVVAPGAAVGAVRQRLHRGSWLRRVLRVPCVLAAPVPALALLRAAFGGWGGRS